MLKFSQKAMKPILDSLDEQTAGIIAERGHKRKFGPEEQVFAEGERAEFLPVVITGQIKMVRYPEPGKEVIIGTFGPGEIFAIPPALDGKQFPATAVAMKESSLLLVPRNEFLSMMRASPEFSAMIMERMCGLLRDRSETIRILATASAEQRVASVLVQIAEQITGDGPCKIAHRRQDIAEMAGLTIETTIRSIRKLADRGHLRIVRGKIYIDSTEPLKALVR